MCAASIRRVGIENLAIVTKDSIGGLTEHMVDHRFKAMIWVFFVEVRTDRLCGVCPIIARGEVAEGAKKFGLAGRITRSTSTTYLDTVSGTP